MALGDSIEVTFMVGAGKTDHETIEVKGPGGIVILETAETYSHAPVAPGLVAVTAYTRKGVKVERLVVGVPMFVAAVERKRR